MSLSRYSFSRKGIKANGKRYVSMSNASTRIFRAVESQQVNYSVHILEEGERLDYLAGIFYGDSSLWWLISVANPQLEQNSIIPPFGVQIRIPQNVGGAIAQYNAFNESI